CSAWIEPQINVKRLAGRVMLTGAFLYLPLVFMPEADSLKHPQLFYLTSHYLANMKSVRKTDVP
ncbi:hypothetical protein ABK576_RS24825, partial [Escherichia coli]|nr:hypothetical protein [Escherichia coli]